MLRTKQLLIIMGISLLAALLSSITLIIFIKIIGGILFYCNMFDLEDCQTIGVLVWAIAAYHLVAYLVKKL